MLKNLCEAINGIDGLIKIEVIEDGSYISYDDIFKDNCPYKKNVAKNECQCYEEIASSAFITLLKNFESVDEENVESDKLVQYVILWLSYIIMKNSNIKITTLKDFYTKHIVSNTHYNQKTNGYSNNKINKDLIDRKINSMTIGIKDMSKCYTPFKLLCKLYTEFDVNNSDCTKYLDKAKEFVSEYQKLLNDTDTEDISYGEILSTLSNDYDNFKNKCKDSSFLPTVEKIQSTVKGYDKGSVQPIAQSSEVASPNPSIANTLIPVLSIFTAILIFLGITYKYSLFGFDKRFQKQYLRDKLKKIKKKMKQYI
ncbi:Plasmodium variant antigen protein Cir/Yir/Bir, putative [Plasmodium chabaudi chabaudi]|uniref:Plasmodium variant antigen protein Cir/Yir/Bir, putative n=1 Tax=Plasmodium chabaudi chabaudi TaxID=31271 RepID=A0A1D3L7W0_PLACU|nr:Plasmodium variant antigen protein Cir/Yir/Bir, putative [Plasmodium chabaudi chabaudi]